MTTAFTIRAGRAEDVPGIILLIQSYVDEGKLLARTLNEIDELLPNFFVAATGDGEIIGCAALEIYSPKLAEIRSLAVSREAQRLGVGRRLVNACVERARLRKVLEVMAITSSDSFFQSCGFDYTLPGEKRALFVQTRDEA
ncbi:MAG: GNAT family N-acetyltransferase [Anaerolineae bacterium]|nr:GNAT family N-acetyltransferase [Anaerolineae bacterium]